MAAASLLAGCSATSRGQTVTFQEQRQKTQSMWRTDPAYASIYGEKLDEPYPLPAIPYQRINPKYYRQVVADPTGQPPGTLVVDTGSHFLYFTQGNGQAMRYGVGLGRAGFAWSGRGVIQYKRRWPKWTPPVEMVERQPELVDKIGPEGSMEPGLKNPLGARALYIFQGGEDTLYRIHGSPEWWTIGKSVSSGCVRMINQDVCDLFDRVPNKTPIVVTDLSRSGYEMSNNIDDPYADREFGQFRDPDSAMQQDDGVYLEGPV